MFSRDACVQNATTSLQFRCNLCTKDDNKLDKLSRMLTEMRGLQRLLYSRLYEEVVGEAVEKLTRASNNDGMCRPIKVYFYDPGSDSRVLRDKRILKN